jgi:hypothetical protein
MVDEPLLTFVFHPSSEPRIMANFIILAAMKGRFISDQGNTYDNFQMLGYAEASNSKEAVSVFFEQAPYPINWADVEYMWAEELANSADTGHHGEYDRVYVESLRRRWESPPRN